MLCETPGKYYDMVISKFCYMHNLGLVYNWGFVLINVCFLHVSVPLFERTLHTEIYFYTAAVSPQTETVLRSTRRLISRGPVRLPRRSGRLVTQQRASKIAYLLSATAAHSLAVSELLDHSQHDSGYFVKQPTQFISYFLRRGENR